MDIVSRDNIFNQTSPLKVDRNAFDLSHKQIGAWDMGVLYPVSAIEVYPNDNIKSSIQSKLIFNTMKFPIYQNLRASFYSFDVAYRNLWKHWRNYYTGGRKGNFTAQEPKVNLNCASNIKGSLFDYLGFPLQNQLKGDVFVSAFPFIAYDFCYYWNFINPELQENIVYDIQDEISNNTSGINIIDELNYYLYYSKDFYLSNEDGIPLYCRMLSPLINPGFERVVSINSDRSVNDRFYYKFKAPNGVNTHAGLVYKDNSTLKAWSVSDEWNGTITNDIYRKAVNLGFLFNVNWGRDYFTSAHLSQQQGSPTSIPLSTLITGNIPSGTVIGTLPTPGAGFVAPLSKDFMTGENVTFVDGIAKSGVSGDTNFNGRLGSYIGDVLSNNIDLGKFLTATSSSFTANDFRLFWQINMIKENVLFNKKNFEYASYLKFFFGRGPNTSDLQQPVYIDSFDLDIYVGEIMQTSQTTDTTSLGERGGIASSIDRDYFQSWTFDEVGVNMILMYIMPREIYQSSQGVNRQWLRNDRFDYYNPLLSRIGLQEIQNQEIYAQGNASDTQPFGYTPAFNELRYIPDQVVSDMRDSLDAWHMARKYAKLPVLNSSYILADPTKRIYNIQQTDTPNITGLINIIQIAYRDMPELAIPELLDHRY